MNFSAVAGLATRDGAPWRALATVPAGGLVALVTVTYTMSYAALLFSGGLAAAYPAGLACMLVGGAVAGVATALLSSIRFVVSAPDSNVVAILAVALAPLGWMAETDGGTATMAATALVAMIGASLAGSLVFGGLGLARAGRLIRFLPFPVIAGFLGASGWFLLVGGLRVGTGLQGLAAMPEPEHLAPLLACLAGAGVLAVVAGRLGRSCGLPLLILAGIALHHAIAAGLGADRADQVASGWLPRMPASLPLHLPWEPSFLAQVDWTALAGLVTDLPLLLIVATIGLLMNVSGIEAATAEDADIDRELQVAAGAALATAAGGGLFGIISPGRSLLLLQAGGRGRIGGVTAGLLGGVLPMLYPAALGLIPRWVLGALLVFLGLDLLRRWLLASRRDLPFGEWLLVLAVTGLTIGSGFLIGLLAGLFLACGQFITLYGRASPIRARYDGTGAEGGRARPDQDRAALRDTGGARLVLHLQGFLFFGTANRILEMVRAEFDQPGGRTPHSLDFREVVGLDGSAAMAFARLGQFVHARGVQLVLTGLSPLLAGRLGPLAGDPAIPRLPTVQEGLDWMEEDALARLPPRSPPPSLGDRLAAAMGGDAAARFLASLPAEEVPPGTVLMRQDEASDDVVLLETGRVAVHIRYGEGRSLTLRSEGPGALIGELGFLLGTPRSATVVAETRCGLRRLSRADLDRLESDAPDLALRFHRLLGQLLAHRIQDKDRLLAGMMRGLRPVGADRPG